jgi:outer membrane protein OmpA-like peptidoglycan-associated protein
MKNIRTLTALAVVAALAAGCETPRQNQTAVGTGAGAVTGAAVGAMVGGGKGAAIGAGIGGGIGAAVGYNWGAVKDKLGIATKGSGVQVAEQKDGSLKVNVPGSVSFASGSSSLDSRLFPTLDKIASTLNEYPETSITVVGYTDSVGSAEANQALSQRRASAVAEYLGQHGVARNRMAVDSRGEAEPIADNETEAGRAQNRRVEMVVRPMKMS